MSKRKRNAAEDGTESHIEDQALRIKVSRLKAKISQGNHSLTAALKLAKGFERQKMGRRQKQASKDPNKLLRLREEVVILRELSPPQTAQNYLLKHMTKTKRIRESPAFIAIYGADPSIESARSQAEANVLGLLFKSSPVTSTLHNVMEGIISVVEPSQIVLQSSESPSDIRGLMSDFDGFPEDSNHVENRANANTGDDTGGLPDSRVGRSATSAGDDDDEEEQAIFLPSLSMAGYFSGSESDDDHHESSNQPGQLLRRQRKNRRGQRERQLIAEKKYGSSAIHLVKKKDKPQKDNDWHPRKGAVVNKQPTVKFHQSTSLRTNALKAQDPHAQRIRPNNKTEPEAIHPSWEAARRKKLQNSNQSLVFSGKKVTFD